MRTLTTFIVLALLLGTACNAPKSELTAEEAKTLAKEAYIYGFPMVMNYKTMWLYTLNQDSPEYKGDFNQKKCEARVYTPEDKSIVTPNSDTPYCMFWADLRQEPRIITIPEVADDRYFSFQLIDLYTHNFAYIGTLSTGNQAGNYLIATTDWKGEKPDGIDQILYCETDLFFIIVRTQLFNDDDINMVKSIQDAYGFMGMNEYLGKESPGKVTDITWPEWHEGDQFTAASLSYIDFMINLTEPHESEIEFREQLKRLHVGSEGDFSLQDFSEVVQRAIREGVKEGFAEIESFIAEASVDPLSSAKVFGTRDFLAASAKKNYQKNQTYLPRAAAAHIGLYGNSGAEAIYPSYLVEAPGVPFNASENNYTLTFNKGEMPPVKAFWSLTMYDGSTQLLVDNALDRYLLNSTMEEDFIYDDDGTLTLYIQKDSPGGDLENNWLPAPEGPFYCVLRLYGPEDNALEGSWVNPPIVRRN